MRNYGFLIATCIALPSLAIAQDKAVESSAAYAHFKQAFSQICFLDSDTAAREYYPSESWELSWQYDYSDQTETAILYKFFCGSGAYNVNHVYYLDAEFDGPHPLGFATPHFDVVYENDDFDGAVVDIPLNGYESVFVLTNSEFDPETVTITSHALWRGIGDAFSGGTWRFLEGSFVLKSFDVDAQYDGEQRPKRLVNFE